MAAPSTLTFDLVPPRRPGPDDVDPTVEDYTAPFAPTAGMPYANQLNQWAKLVQAAWRMLPVCSIEIHYASGVPFIYAVQASGSTIVAGTFTVVDNGNGDTTIKWPVDTFAVTASSPTAEMCEDGSWLAPTAVLGTFGGLPGVQVRTRNSAGTLTNAKVKVHIY